MIIKRFLRPKWKHANPEIRKQSIAKLDSKHKDYTSILKLLAQDPSPEVAHLAISKILDLQTLHEQLSQDTNSPRQQALINQIVDIFCDKDSSLSNETEKLAFIQNCQHRELLICLATKVEQQTIQLAVVGKVDTEEDLEAIAIQCNSSSIRLVAAEKIHQYENLLRLSKQVRGRDKAVYRLIKDRLALENEKRVKQAENNQFRDDLLNTIENLAKKTYFPQYSQKFSLIQHQWNELGEQYRSTEFDKKFQQASHLCQAFVDEKKAEQQKQQETLTASNEFTKICQRLESHFTELNGNIQDEQADLLSSNTLIETQQALWQTANALVTPPSDLLQRYKNIMTRHEHIARACQQYQQTREQLETLLSHEKESLQLEAIKALLGDINWPQDFLKPSLLDQATNALETEKKHLIEHKRESQLELKTIQTKLQKLSTAIDAGSLKTANRLHKEIHQAEIRGTLSQNKNTQQQFKQLGGQLKELNDWQGFSSSNKKTELCEKMEALIDHPCDPDDKAKQIKLLQESWQKSGSSSNQALWVRFKKASDIAYEPCKSYFAQHAEIRQNNLQERGNICQQLDTFIEKNDWQNANWQAAVEINRTAKQQWKHFSPVERSKGNLLQKQFNLLLGKLDELIQTEQRQNTEKKESIIRDAENLLSLSDEREAIEKAKQLQAKWKTIGITPRNRDDKLWKVFRQHCDALFERRDQARRSAQNQQTQQLNQAKSLCEQLENASKSLPEVLLETPGLASQIDKQLKSLKDLPKEQADSLRKRYQRAADVFAKHLASARNLLQQQQLQKVRNLADWLNASTEQTEQQWQALIEGIPPSWLEPFSRQHHANINSQAVKQVEDVETRGESEKAHQAKALLCIRMEILAGVDSPEEAKSERMAYQVDRLSREMKSSLDISLHPKEASPDKIETAIQIELEWLNLSLLDKSSSQEKRFELARTNLWSQNSGASVSNTSHQSELENSL